MQETESDRCRINRIYLPIFFAQHMPHIRSEGGHPVHFRRHAAEMIRCEGAPKHVDPSSQDRDLQNKIALISPIRQIEQNRIRHRRKMMAVSHPARFRACVLTIGGSDDRLYAMTLYRIGKQMKIRKCGLLNQQKNGLHRIQR